MRELLTIWLKQLNKLAQGEDGAVAIEYAMIAGTVTLAIAFAVSDIGNSLTAMYSSFASGI